MEPSLALGILRQLRGGPLREVIPSTLGEPLLWEGLDALADAAAAAGLLLNVTTNGTWPGRGARAWGERLAPVAADLKISWNGATAATAAAIMDGLDLAAAIDGVREVAAARDAAAARTGRRCRLSFQVTAQEGNVAELAAIVRLARDLGIDRVKVNQLQVQVPALAPRALGASADGIRRWNGAVAAMRAASAGGRGEAGAVALQGDVLLPERPGERLAAGPCPFVGREGWILAGGAFAPCPHPAAWSGELGDFGDASRTPLRELWEGPALRRLAEGYPDHPVCRACPFRRPGGA